MLKRAAAPGRSSVAVVKARNTAPVLLGLARTCTDAAYFFFSSATSAASSCSRASSQAGSSVPCAAAGRAAGSSAWLLERGCGRSRRFVEIVATWPAFAVTAVVWRACRGEITGCQAGTCEGPRFRRTLNQAGMH